MGLLQILSHLDFGEDAHLLDGDFVQLLEPLRLGNPVVVMVGESPAAVASRFGYYADCPGSFNPHLRRKDKRICSRFISKLVEFDHVKTGVVQLLPKTEERDGHL